MFNQGEVICFLGDSLTARGLYMAEVYQHLNKKYKVKCYNIGTPGGRVCMAEKYLYRRCLVHNPDYVAVMYGINDVEHTYYRQFFPQMTDRELENKAIEIYKQCYESVIKKIVDFGAKPIVMIPPPYDEVSDVPTPNRSQQSRLELLYDFLEETAEKYGCPLIDFKSVMLPMLGKRQVISEDRVHPSDEGYHVMAQIFLKQIGETETMDFDTPFVFDEKNKLRFDEEQKLRWFNFVEYCALFDVNEKTAEEKIKQASKLYEECPDKTAPTAEGFRDYAMLLESKERIMGEIVRLTV